MKKTKKTLLTAAALAAAFNMAACTSPVGKENPATETTKYEPSEEEVYGVYGPPEDYDDSSSSAAEKQDGSEAANDVVSDDYDPSEEEIYDVYGPPADYYDDDDNNDDDGDKYETTEAYIGDDEPEEYIPYPDDYDDYDPEFEDVQIVYGPAPDY